MNATVKNLMLHNEMGESVPNDELEAWGLRHNRLFNVTSYTWESDDRVFSSDDKTNWELLPDSSGFICLDYNQKERNNCFLRNAFGEVTHQLTVPWELTGHDVPADADMWFINICEHVDGEFGVSAYVEYAGDFYFELDYHNAKFLWGKPIRI